MKKNFYYLFIILAISSCTINDLVLDDTLFDIKLTNYTESSWNEGTLYVGAKNIQGEFIATDSIKYTPVPSNISPMDSYNSGDIYDSRGEYQGNTYYKHGGLQYVNISYPITSFGSLFIDKDEILEVSRVFGFVFKLSDGQKKYIEAYDIYTGFDDPNSKNKLYINFDIKTTEITGKITTNSY